MTRLRPLAILAGLATMLSLSGCVGNQYQEPNGAPKTWGQQHYLDNQSYQKINNDRIPL